MEEVSVDFALMGTVSNAPFSGHPFAEFPLPIRHTSLYAHIGPASVCSEKRIPFTVGAVSRCVPVKKNSRACNNYVRGDPRQKGDDGERVPAQRGK